MPPQSEDLKVVFDRATTIVQQARRTIEVTELIINRVVDRWSEDCLLADVDGVPEMVCILKGAAYRTQKAKRVNLTDTEIVAVIKRQAESGSFDTQ